MKEVFFVLKVLVITFVVVMLMQIRVGQLTLEERASVLIQDSWLTGQVQNVGDGLQKVLGQVTGSLGKKVSAVFKKEEAPSERNIIKLERSATYKKEAEAKATASASR